MYMLQVKFDFRLNLIFLCSRLITIFLKQRKIQINDLGKIKFNLKSNLTCNIYVEAVLNSLCKEEEYKINLCRVSRSPKVHKFGSFSLYKLDGK